MFDEKYTVHAVTLLNNPRTFELIFINLKSYEKVNIHRIKNLKELTTNA